MFQCGNNKFTCDDGHCIDFEKRCNKVADCIDFSDELRCQTAVVDLQNYRRNDPPIQSQYDQVEVEVDLTLISIHEIREMEMKFTCKLELEVKWKDWRITFNHLKARGNVLSSQKAQSLWIPDLVFFNSRDSDEDDIDIESGKNQQISIKREGEGKWLDISNVMEEKVYKGKENSIVFNALYVNQFQCDYNLRKYPFDTQTCTIDLEVTSATKEYLTLVPGICKYIGPQAFSQYRIENVKLTSTFNKTGLTCEFHLKRQTYHHVYMTFIPTFCILVMALASLFIDEVHFGSVIMVSMTCMLVLYTIYENITATMPVTAYMKLLDYWLIFNIMMPFAVFITLVAIEVMKKRSLNQTMGYCEDQGGYRKSFKKTMRVILPLISFLFLVSYLTIVILDVKDFI